MVSKYKFDPKNIARCAKHYKQHPETFAQYRKENKEHIDQYNV